MTRQKRLHDLVLMQLHQYPLTKRLLSEYEEIHLPAHTQEERVRTSYIGDPTGKQALSRLEPSEDIQNMRSWIWAIEQAWELLREASPDKARLMEHLFGLNGQKVLYGTAYRREEMMRLMHISEPTVYRWREEIITAVMAGAIQAGVLVPYKPQAG